MDQDKVREARSRWIDAVGGRESPSTAAGISRSAVELLDSGIQPALEPQQVVIQEEALALLRDKKVEIGGEALELLRSMSGTLTELLDKINNFPAAQPPALQANPVVPPPPPPASVDMFDDGNGHQNYVDPLKQCGICLEKCAPVMAMYSCGHYPYCKNCIKTLKNNKNSIPVWQRLADFDEYKFNCPNCNGKAKDAYELYLLDEA